MTRAADLEPVRHPDDGDLIAFATGGLPLLRRLVVETHVALCPLCVDAMRDLARPGAAWLDAVDPTPPPRDAWERLLRAVDRPDEETKNEAAVASAESPGEPPAEAPVEPIGDPVPSFLWAELDRAARTAPWQPLGESSTELAWLGRDPDAALDLYLVRTPAGETLPAHRHLGQETVVVLTGSYSDATGRVGPGDFQSSEVDSVHEPHIGREGACWALVCVGTGLDFGARPAADPTTADRAG